MGRKPKNSIPIEIKEEVKKENVKQEAVAPSVSLSMNIDDEKRSKMDEATLKKIAKARAWEEKMVKAKSVGSNVIVSHAKQLLDMVDVVPTNIPSLDWALGIGGIGRGRIYEVFGDPGTGKTALMYQIMGRFQRRNKIVMFIDAEHTFDPLFAKVFGFDAEAETFLKLVKPTSTEQAFEIINSAIEEGIVDLICVDSIPLLTPKGVVEKRVNIDKTIAMYKAQVFGNHLIELVPKMSKAGASVIFSNHVAIADIGDRFAKYKDPKTKGGQEIEYNADIRFYLVNKGKVFNKDEEVIGAKVQYRVIKNKQAPNYRKSQTVFLNWGRGIMINLDIINMAKQFNIINQTSPGWFEVQGVDGKIQGFDNVIKQIVSTEGLLKSMKKEVYRIIDDQKTLKDEQCEVDMEKSTYKDKKKDSEENEGGEE